MQDPRWAASPHQQGWAGRPAPLPHPPQQRASSATAASSSSSTLAPHGVKDEEYGHLPSTPQQQQQQQDGLSVVEYASPVRRGVRGGSPAPSSPSFPSSPVTSRRETEHEKKVRAVEEMAECVMQRYAQLAGEHQQLEADYETLQDTCRELQRQASEERAERQHLHVRLETETRTLKAELQAAASRYDYLKDDMEREKALHSVHAEEHTIEANILREQMANLQKEWGDDRSAMLTIFKQREDARRASMGTKFVQTENPRCYDRGTHTDRRPLSVACGTNTVTRITMDSATLADLPSAAAAAAASLPPPSDTSQQRASSAERSVHFPAQAHHHSRSRSRGVQAEPPPSPSSSSSSTPAPSSSRSNDRSRSRSRYGEHHHHRHHFAVSRSTSVGTAKDDRRSSGTTMHLSPSPSRSPSPGARIERFDPSKHLYDARASVSAAPSGVVAAAAAAAPYPHPHSGEGDYAEFDLPTPPQPQLALPGQAQRKQAAAAAPPQGSAAPSLAKVEDTEGVRQQEPENNGFMWTTDALIQFAMGGGGGGGDGPGRVTVEEEVMPGGDGAGAASASEASAAHPRLAPDAVVERRAGAAVTGRSPRRSRAGSPQPSALLLEAASSSSPPAAAAGAATAASPPRSVVALAELARGGGFSPAEAQQLQREQQRREAWAGGRTCVSEEMCEGSEAGIAAAAAAAAAAHELALPEHPASNVAWPIGALCRTASGALCRIKARAPNGFVVESDVVNDFFLPYAEVKVLRPATQPASPTTSAAAATAGGTASRSPGHSSLAGTAPGGAVAAPPPVASLSPSNSSVGGRSPGRAPQQQHQQQTAPRRALHPAHYQQSAKRNAMPYTPKKYSLPMLPGC